MTKKIGAILTDIFGEFRKDAMRIQGGRFETR